MASHDHTPYGRRLPLLDDGERERMLREAVKFVADEAIMIPLFHLSLVWGLRQGLSFQANMSGYTAASLMRRE